MRALPAVRRLELSATPEGISTGGDDGVLPVSPVEAILLEVVRVGISDAIVSAVDSRPMREILRFSMKDIEFSLEIFGTQRRACVRIWKFFTEDLVAYRRSASKRGGGESPFGVMIAADGLQNPAERVTNRDLHVFGDARSRKTRKTNVCGLRASFCWLSLFEGVYVKIHLRDFDLRLDSRSIPCMMRFWVGKKTLSNIPNDRDHMCSSASSPVSKKIYPELDG